MLQQHNEEPAAHYCKVVRSQNRAVSVSRRQECSLRLQELSDCTRSFPLVRNYYRGIGIVIRKGLFYYFKWTQIKK